jgi:hypothetical protein
MDNFSGHKLGV